MKVLSILKWSHKIFIGPIVRYPRVLVLQLFVSSYIRLKFRLTFTIKIKYEVISLIIFLFIFINIIHLLHNIII